MIGPPILAGGVSLFVFTFFPGTLPWIVAGFFCLVSILFFILGVRLVIYGGQWGCFIDDQYMTWTFPSATAKQDQQVPLESILRFIVRIERDGGDMKYSYFIETGTGRLPIDIECFFRAKKLGKALLEANAAIELVIEENGEQRFWVPEQVGRWF